MHLALSGALVLTAYLSTRAQALPHPAPAPQYSVVDVAGPATTTAPAQETVYATTTESSTSEETVTLTTTESAEPQIITNQAATITVSVPSEETVEATSTSVVVDTVEATSISIVQLPASTVTATETQNIGAQYTGPLETSSTSSLRPAFTSSSCWNSTLSYTAWPTSAGTALYGTASGVVYPSATASYQKRWTPTGGTAVYKRWAGPTASGGYLAGRAAPTVDYLARGASPTGDSIAYAQSWNETQAGWYKRG